MIVLGIDPGTARLGYGLVERQGSHLTMLDYGCLETVNDRPFEQLRQILSALSHALTGSREPLLRLPEPSLNDSSTVEPGYSTPQQRFGGTTP